MKNIFLILLFFLLSVYAVYGQRFPERMNILNTLFNQSKNAAGVSLMNSIGGWAEFGGYVSDKHETHAWYQKLGTFFEFFRINDDKSFSVLSNIEFIADPHNDINFNPRAIFWEEALLYSQRAGNNFWQAGYYHRCKHDIDNIEYGTERSLIYGSLMGRYIYKIIDNADLKLIASAKGDFYTILQDYRKPEITEETNLKNLSSSFTLNLYFQMPFNNLVNFISSSFIQINSFSGEPGFFKKYISMDSFNSSAGIQAGALISGNAKFIALFRYEYFDDTGFNIISNPSHLISIGISFLPGEIY